MKNLSEKSLLVNLNIGTWSARKYDRKVTQEVNDKHGSTDAGRFNKLLIASKYLEAITKIANAARVFHYENTLPWSDAGERLLPSDNYFEYTSELSKLKNQFESEVNNFANLYPAMVSEAKINLNGLFNPLDYPVNVSEKFRIKTSFMPVPDIADLRINLSENEVNDLTKQIQDEMNERFAASQRNIYERIAEQLKHMKERLTDKDATFRNSLFENVLSLVDLLPRLNVANDSNIVSICQELKSLYCDPETVRTSKRLRSEKAQEVENMLSKLDAFLKPVKA